MKNILLLILLIFSSRYATASTRSIDSFQISLLKTHTDTVKINLWNKIWKMKELENRRSYIADFEVYDHRSIDPSNAIVDIYIGVK